MNSDQPVIIAGPCSCEKFEVMVEIYEVLFSLLAFYGMTENFYFKASVDKANRTSIKGDRGLGFDEGLDVLAAIKDRYECKIVTDVHETYQVDKVQYVVDMIQIPALLSRQTDLIVAAAETGLPISIKKGQFMAPWDVQGIMSKVDSVRDPFNTPTYIVERGTSFGYNNLVVDFTGIEHMASDQECEVIFDCTHSVQKPSKHGTISGGSREQAIGLAKAAIAQGFIKGLFAEVHVRPEQGISDQSTMLYIEQFEEIIKFYRYILDARKYGRI